MPIRTRLAFPAWKLLIIAVGSLLLAAWGAYDLWVTIPRREAAFAAYETARAKLDAAERAIADGRAPTAVQAAELDQARRELAAATPNGKTPKKPSKWDRLTQWFFIACAPFALGYAAWFFRVSRRTYQLDDDGGLRIEGDARAGAGQWAAEDIVDIDMSRWMRKSVAEVRDRDGRALKLDAHYYCDLDRIVGAIASRLHPDQWTADAKPVKRSVAREDDEANRQAGRDEMEAGQ